MADIKISQIPAAPPTSPNDQVLGVIGGTTDALFSIAQIAGVAPSPAAFSWQNIVSDWGAVGDGITDDSSAFLNFRAYARTQSNGVVLVIPPGVYLTPSAQQWFTGIANLTVFGYGATLKNFSRGGAFLQTGLGVSSALIASTAIGDTGVYCLTLAQTALFPVGSWVAIASLEMQTIGYPPNFYNVEYVFVASAPTGNIVNIYPALRYNHLSTFPAVAGEIWNGGPAAIYLLDQTWVQNVEFYGLVLDSPSQIDFCARSAYFRDCIFLGGGTYGFAPSMTLLTVFQNCQFVNGLEMDKDIDTIKFIDCIHFSDMVVYSSSVDRLIIDNNEMLARLLGTTARLMTIRDSHVSQIYVGNQGYGPAGALILDNSRIDSVANNPGENRIPAGNVSYANGVFSMVKTSPNLASIYPFAVPGAIGFLNIIDGTENGYCYPFVVMSVADDGTNINMTTTLDLATLPTVTIAGVGGFTTTVGWLNMHPAPRLSARDCTGDPIVISASKAPQDNPWLSYRHATFMPGISGSWQSKSLSGQLVKIRVNVIRPYTGAQPSVCFYPCDTPGALYFDPLTATGAIWRSGTPGAFVDTTIAHERVITPGANTGVQGSDNLPTIAAASNGKGMWMNMSGPGLYDSSGNAVNISGDTQFQWPIIELEIMLDQGINGLSSLYAGPPVVA